MGFSGAYLSASDLFRKLEEEGASLGETITSRHLINFAMTAYHLTEWVLGGNYAQSVKADIAVVRNAPEFLACKDISNGSKHFKITKYAPATKGTVSQKGFGYGRYGHGPWGEGEESITIEMKDGTIWDAVKFKDDVLALWRIFFSKHAIPIS